jgi:anaerobic ribonucleoside-triphosphate reductase activating protein
MKYTDAKVTFAEVPDEIALCINISNCPCHCVGCHSSYLAEDIGEPLDEDVLAKLIDDNEGITCVAFMGGDAEPNIILELARFIRAIYTRIKVAWYSGRDKLPNIIEDEIDMFDFIKLGPYIEELGPLNETTTNQRFYKVVEDKLVDITLKLW